MSKRYLIRRNLETFLGPYDVEELKKAYQRMEFGLQDEVGGSFGEWVAFDDLEKIEDQYPELMVVVKDTMLGGWGFSQNTATRIIDKKTKKVKKSKQSPQEKKSSAFTVLMLLIIVLAGGSAYYFARNTGWGFKFFRMTRTTPATQFEKLLRSGDKSSFINSFQSKLPSIIKDARKSRDNLNNWLPSMRAYAFLTEGSVPGVSARIIKGEEGDNAPSSCNLAYWRREWQNARSTLEQFTSGFPANQRLNKWQQMLLWDPYWIARRSDNKDWIYPKNYYHACLLMAQKAFVEVFPVPTKPEERTASVEKIRTRLDQLNAIAESGNSYAYEPALPEPEAEAEVAVGSFDIIACFDESEENADVSKCFEEPKVPEAWKKYIAYRDTVTTIRIKMKSFINTVAQEDLQELSQQSSLLNRTDLLTGLKYSAESRFVRNLLRNNGDVLKSVNELKYDHQNVNVLIGH